MNNEIILTTANARYSHSSMGLRCIFANLGELQEKALIIEHTIKDEAKKIVADWLLINPKIIGVGIYIWNIELMSEAIKLLKSTNPEVAVVIGGPEVSYGVSSELYQNSDFIVELEGEEVFKTICDKILNGTYPEQKVVRSNTLDTTKIKMPYEFYNEDDIKNRKIYVEASRGCAFKCHFCLSSLDEGIRNFDIDLFLDEINKLYKKGARQFKFVDRTFNLDIKLSTKILTFFLDTYPDQDYFLHFEVIPDRLPGELKKHIMRFKPGVLQFEVGIQTFDKEVSRRIGRKQNKEKAIENLTFLRHETNAHLHVDLIIGLPGATLQVFKEDLNQLVGIGLQEVQIGMLKLLKGTPLIQHKESFKLDFDISPPYEIRSNIDIDSTLMIKLSHFQKFWDKFFNSGNFISTMGFIIDKTNPFDEFFKLSQFCFEVWNRTHNISLDDQCDILCKFLQKEYALSFSHARELILKDILNKKGRKVPPSLKDYDLGIPEVDKKDSKKSLKRQRNI